VRPFERWRAGAALAAALIFAQACADAPPPTPKVAERPAVAPLHDGPLTDYVPSAGLRWLVVGRPKELASDSTLAQPLELLFPRARLEAFGASSGVQLPQTSEALIAGFDHATLFMASTPPGTIVPERFSERLLSEPSVKSPHPRIHRITGVVGSTPETLVHIDGKLAALSVGSSLPARVAQLYALGKLDKSPPALRGAALSALPLAELETAPVRFYAPGPFAGEWAQGARGLLATAVAAGIAVRPAAGARIAVDVAVAGDFRSLSADPAQLLLDAWNDLASSNLGRLLGLSEPAAAPVTNASPELLRLSVELNPLPLAQGLRAAVMAEVWEILRLEPPVPPSEPVSPSP